MKKNKLPELDPEELKFIKNVSELSGRSVDRFIKEENEEGEEALSIYNDDDTLIAQYVIYGDEFYFIPRDINFSIDDILKSMDKSEDKEEENTEKEEE